MSRHEDDEQFRLFVQRQWGPLLRTAYLLTGDRGTAEDLAQSALEKTHRRWGRVLRRDAPEVYVRRVMVNTAISRRRRRRPLEVPLLTSDSAPTPDAYAQVEERHLLLAALRRAQNRGRRGNRPYVVERLPASLCRRRMADSEAESDAGIRTVRV